MKNTSALTVFGPSCGEALRQLPEDLRRCLGPERLLQLAFDAVQVVAPATGALAARGELNPRMLLTLLTYCYGSGIGGSAEVAWAAATDATVRYICAGQMPSALEICRFRRENRGLLEQCLAHTLAAACACYRSSDSRADQCEDSGLRDWARDSDHDSGILSRARRTLARAIQFDTAESE